MVLKVGHLKKLLEDYDDETVVLLSSDEEGNSYHLWGSYGNDLKYGDSDVVILYPSHSEVD